jgi:hypothetical protein
LERCTHWVKVKKPAVLAKETGAVRSWGSTHFLAGKQIPTYGKLDCAA